LHLWFSMHLWLLLERVPLVRSNCVRWHRDCNLHLQGWGKKLVTIRTFRR
jgi:hypothetical protein